MPRLAGIRIVIAEDEPLLLQILGETLELAGADVVATAHDVEGAAALAQAEMIDVAVLDLDLRGHPSIPAARALRRRGVAVVFASGSDMGALPADLRGCRIVRKPYGCRELEAAIREAAGGWRFRSVTHVADGRVPA